ncbi:MAG: lipid A deacylase LpxR family protein [Bacteroidia bacterium]|nr:lipid A deacylase LpxR family protein [Bacteroidia bacterium]HRP31380.1 lipid A deacylase LpxR family protein [Agriterribacter sp.]
MKRFLVILFVASVFCIKVSGQNINDNAHLSIMTENDLYSFPGGGTDRYYTNGLRIDYYYTKSKEKFPTNLLLKISDDKKVFGWGVAQYMFTPSRIDTDSILYNDRPYAGALFAIHSLSSYDNTKKIKLTTELLLGVMGPLSFAEETQTAVHKLIDAQKPEGWKNQIPNDIVINYNIKLQKEIFNVPEKLFLSGVLETYAGTLYDAMGAGLSMNIGKINNLWYSPEICNKKKYQLYLTFSPTVRLIYYNALLQGGIISGFQNSPKGYRLDKDDIERLSTFTEFGIVYEQSIFKISFLQKMRTAPFKGGHTLEYGNIAISFKF